MENTTANPVVILAATNLATLATFNKKDIKAKKIILDAVKDHVIPHISGKDCAHEMWSSLTNLYQSSNEMVLREKLKSIMMTKSDNVTCYQTRITQMRDELGAIGEVITSSELVRTSFNGVAKPWVVFVEAIVARENMPSWNRLWDDLLQEETLIGNVHGGSSGN